MTDEETGRGKVVQLSLSAPGRAAHNDEVGEKARHWREAVELGRLARLTTLSYERERLAAAKKFGCRPNVLDRMIALIREELDNWASRIRLGGCATAWPRLRDQPNLRGQTSQGDDGGEALILEAAAAADGTVHVLLLAADGSGDTIRATLCRKVAPWNPDGASEASQ